MVYLISGIIFGILWQFCNAIEQILIAVLAKFWNKNITICHTACVLILSICLFGAHFS